MKKFFTNLFAVVPILSTLTISTYLFTTPSAQKPSIEPTPIVERESDNATGEMPNNLFFPTLGINLKVKSANVEVNNWELYEDAASYLKTSSKIGTTGNTVIYAHNKAHLFGPLKNLKIGDSIKVSTENSQKLFIVKEKKVVSPAQVDIVYPTNDQRITLFTCTNFLDADRLVIVAKPATTFNDLL